MRADAKVPAAGAQVLAVDETALWKAVALSGANGFSGALLVQDGERSGRIFFEGGRLLHAEAGAQTGEAAFKAMLLWPASAYAIEPDLAPGEVTITRGLAVLLVELKGRAAGAELTPTPGLPTPLAPVDGRASWLAAATERIRQLPGVVGATLHEHGAPVAELAPRTPEEAAAVRLLEGGQRLGDALGAGRLVLGVGRGDVRHVLLVAVRDHLLTVLLRADGKVDAVQAQIRALLHPQS